MWPQTSSAWRSPAKQFETRLAYKTHSTTNRMVIATITGAGYRCPRGGARGQMKTERCTAKHGFIGARNVWIYVVGVGDSVGLQAADVNLAALR